VHAAQELGRQWIGIDVTHLAIGLIEKRLRDAFPGVALETHGVPKDLSGARDLAAQPGNLGKEGGDRGLGGNVYFGKTSRAVVSVKAGRNVGVEMVRSLDSIVKRGKAEIGVLLTLWPPTRPMIAGAAAAGRFEEPGFAPVPRLRIVTIADAMRLHHRAGELPARRDDAFRRPAREEAPERQAKLDL
jgi:site-specific DNA-methyltransferase (adenine-specific)